MINLAVIGYGYWGPNLVRNSHTTFSCKIFSICDLKQCALTRAAQSYPSVEVTDDYSSGR
jgi:predicted dehydrogenase